MRKGLNADLYSLQTKQLTNNYLLIHGEKRKMIEAFLKEQINVDLTQIMQTQFKTYCDYLREENEKYNLTAITEPTEIYVKHFADSALGSIAIAPKSKVCDIGSGAGFPSLPLKIVRPDITVTLVDSLQKRISFTRTLCEKLQISAEFYHERAEDFAKTHSERYDVATARAVAPLPVLLEYVAQTVKIGGTVIAYKTDESELNSASNACNVLGLVLDKTHRFVLPDGSNRCLLVFKKIKRTPPKYPRNQNKPRKQPL